MFPSWIVPLIKAMDFENSHATAPDLLKETKNHKTKLNIDFKNRNRSYQYKSLSIK